MRVDLAVEAEESHGLRERPLGRRVRGEAPVVDHEARLEERILEVQVELGHDDGAEHALVHDRARRHRADVALVDVAVLGGNLRLNELAGQVELPVEILARALTLEHDLSNLTSKLITSPSLKGSMAGLVTCANLCLK